MKRFRSAIIYILLPLLFIASALLVGRYSVSLRAIAETILHPAAAPAEAAAMAAETARAR